MEESKIVIEQYANELDAELARGHLEAAGIEAAIVKDDGGSMFPSLQSTEGVQLLVDRSKERDARRVLSEKRAGSKRQGI